MKNIILLSILLFTVQGVKAQASKVVIQKTQQNLDELATSSSHNVVNTFDERYEGVRGTPFYDKRWGTANITLKNTVFENIQAKYNVYENNLLYNNNGKLLVLDLNQVDSFVLKDTLGLYDYSFKRVNSITNIDPKLNNKFAHVIYDGSKIKLISVPTKDYVKADFKGTYSNGRNYDEFRNNDQTYIVNSAGVAEKVKLNKRTLLSSLKDKKEEIEKFISHEQIKTETEAGWSKVLAYYEKL